MFHLAAGAVGMLLLLRAAAAASGEAELPKVGLPAGRPRPLLPRAEAGRHVPLRQQQPVSIIWVQCRHKGNLLTQWWHSKPCMHGPGM